MKKCLVFGFGNQGKKYIKNLKKLGYFVDVVSHRGLSKSDDINSSYLWEDVKTTIHDFTTYELIVVAVHPIENQTEVIQFLLTLNLECKIIIEKPVTYSIGLLEQLLKYHNIAYNVDELYLGLKLGNVPFPSTISCNHFDFTIEHGLGLFLINKDFGKYVASISFQTQNKGDEGLTYKIFSKDDLLYECKQGCIYGSRGELYGSLDLQKSLIFSLGVLLEKKDINFLVKYNYIFLKKFILGNDLIIKDQ